MESAEINTNQLSEIIEMMKKQNLNTMSVSDLLKQINEMTLNNQANSNSSQHTGTTTKLEENIQSPVFTFKTPAKLFTSPISITDTFATLKVSDATENGSMPGNIVTLIYM